LETVDHVFQQCEWVKGVWFGSPMTINFNISDTKPSFTDWLTSILTNNVKEIVANIVSLIYNIWRARNLLIFQAKNVPADCVIQQAMESSFECRTMRSSIHQPGNTSSTRPRGNNINWTPPTNGALKLNVDAHPCDDGRWGLGIVLRTEEGKCVGAATAVVRGSLEILECEALGLADRD
jgi:hypothetical protein